MITKFELFEGKQVGILYHWTDDLDTLEKILSEDKMWSSYGYISFSRNKNLNYLHRAVKITFDGDNMSNHFKLEPHLFNKQTKYKKEAEERIMCTHKYSDGRFITGIKKYITDITVIFNPYNTYDEMVSKVNELQPLIPNVKINIPNDN
jgi:hypothetical protein